MNDVNVPVFRIRIRIRICRICIFLVIPDPHPNTSVTSTDPAPDPSFIVRKTLISTVLQLLYDFLSKKHDVNVPVFRIRICRIPMFLVLPDPHPNPLVTRTDPDPDPSIIKQTL